jgi:hypothetical protein
MVTGEVGQSGNIFHFTVVIPEIPLLVDDATVCVSRQESR